MENSIKTKLPLFTIFLLIIGWSGWIALKQLYPFMNLNWYPYIPISFFVMGSALLIVLEKINKDNPLRLVNIYMLLKVAKIVIVVSMILLYNFVIKTNMRLFLYVLGIYYIIYSVIEYYVFYLTEKKIRQNK